MRDHPAPDALPPLLAEQEADGVTRPDLDPRLRAVLDATRARLTEAPDDGTRRRHLTAIHRTRQRMRRRRRLGRLGRLGTVAAVLLLVLAVVGALPTGLQQAVADAATVVGITLPSPADAGPDRDHGPGEGGDEPAPPEPVENADPASDADGPAGNARADRSHPASAVPPQARVPEVVPPQARVPEVVPAAAPPAASAAREGAGPPATAGDGRPTARGSTRSGDVREKAPGQAHASSSTARGHRAGAGPPAPPPGHGAGPH